MREIERALMPWEARMGDSARLSFSFGGLSKRRLRHLSLPPSPSFSSYFLSSPSLPLSPSPSLLRLRLSLLPPFIHTLQEAMRERERGRERTGEEERDIEELLSFLLEDLKKISPLFLQKYPSTEVISSFGVFWVSANDYAFSLWKSVLHLFCSTPLHFQYLGHLV